MRKTAEVCLRKGDPDFRQESAARYAKTVLSDGAGAPRGPADDRLCSMPGAPETSPVKDFRMATAPEGGLRRLILGGGGLMVSRGRSPVKAYLSATMESGFTIHQDPVGSRDEERRGTPPSLIKDCVVHALAAGH